MFSRLEISKRFTDIDLLELLPGFRVSIWVVDFGQSSEGFSDLLLSGADGKFLIRQKIPKA